MLLVSSLCLDQMQLDNLQMNNYGKITKSTALALQTEKGWKRNWQFAALVTEGGRQRGHSGTIP